MPMNERSFDSENWSAEQKADILRRRIKLYRVCLRDGIGQASAADYRREIAVAEAELGEVLRGYERSAALAANQGAGAHRSAPKPPDPSPPIGSGSATDLAMPAVTCSAVDGGATL
jgi:hypothetical protein